MNTEEQIEFSPEMENVESLQIEDMVKPETQSINDYLFSIESDMNDIIMDPASSGYDSLETQDVVYGITFSVGMDPAHDTVLDLGAGIGEFYSYVERFTGTALSKYIPVDNDANMLEILKFRYAADDTIKSLELDYSDFAYSHLGYNPEVVKNLQTLGNTEKIDWVVSCNTFDDTMTVEHIVTNISIWSSVAEKGAAFTFKAENTDLFVEVLSALLKNERFSTRTIVRSDFIKNWYSIYIYNLRG